MAMFEEVSPNFLGRFSGGAFGRWCEELSRAFKAAAVVAADAMPIRFEPFEWTTKLPLRPSSWCKACRQVRVTINGCGAI